MIFATELSSTNFSVQPQLPPAPLSPMAATKSIGAISLGESSPTSVFVDVTATSPISVSELKRIQSIGNQLMVPEETIYGNDLIKVWNIEDQQCTMTGHQSMIRTPEEPIFSEHYMTPLRQDLPKADESEIIPVISMEDVEESPLAEMDELFESLPPASISLSPRLSLGPLSPPVSPRISEFSLSSKSTESSGSTNTVVLESFSLDEELPKPSRKHRRRHQRNQSHFDFQFI